MASVKIRLWVDLTVEADQSQQVFLGVLKTEIAQILEIDFSLVEDVHFQGYEVAKMHLFVHHIEDTVDKRQVVVGLFILDSPHRCHFLVFFGSLGCFFSGLHFLLDCITGILQVFKVIDDIHVG